MRGDMSDRELEIVLFDAFCEALRRLCHDDYRLFSSQKRKGPITHRIAMYIEAILDRPSMICDTQFQIRGDRCTYTPDIVVHDRQGGEVMALYWQDGYLSAQEKAEARDFHREKKCLTLAFSLLEVGPAGLSGQFDSRVPICAHEENCRKKAEAAADVARKSYERVRRLYENGVMSAQKRDEAEANYKAMAATEQAARAQYEMAVNGAEREDKMAAEAQVNRARGAVEEVSAYIKETFLVSPISGEVSERYPKVGELVGTGSPVMNVLDLEDTWVVFNVREDLLGDMRMGATFTAYVPALGNREVTLKVTYMKDLGTYAAWRATKTTGQYDAKTFQVKAVPLEKVDGLRPGMSVLKQADNSK